ncbi:MAG: nucleotidyltransferase domain-containing protein [Ignavibacteriales bacterium]|nr:nucleotidyltransferase domain-containing protein [Ignavibacteriales bacterium]
MNKTDIIKTLTSYKASNSGKYGIITLGIFGSVARDAARQDSDIDIFIETEQPNPFIIVHIKEELESIFLTRIDIVRLRKSMNPFLKNRIESEGIFV